MKLNAFKGIGTKFSEARQALKAKLPGKHRHHEVLPSKGTSQEALRGSGPTKDGPDLVRRDVETVLTRPLMTTGSDDTDHETPVVQQGTTVEDPPEATPATKDSLKIRLLANVVKKLIGLKTDALDNKEEIQALRQKEKEAESASSKAKKELSRAEDKHKSLRKDLTSHTEKKEKATKKHKPEKVAKHKAEIEKLEAALQQQTDEIARLREKARKLQQQLQQASQEKRDVKDNGVGLLRFSVRFATSLRELYKLQNDQSPEASELRKKKKSFTHPRMVIETEGGSTEIKDLELTLKTIRFKDNDQGRPIPVFGVEALKGKIWQHLPGGECLKVELDLKDVEITIDTGLGKALHSYVTTPNPVEALGRLLSGGVEALGQLKPRLISVKGDKAGVRVDDCRASALTTFIKYMQSTTDSTAEMIFKALGFHITGELEHFNLDVTGDIRVSASANKLALDYQPETGEQNARGITRRKVKAGIGSGAVTARHGLPMVQKVLSAVSSGPEKQRQIKRALRWPWSLPLPVKPAKKLTLPPKNLSWNLTGH